MTFSPGLCQRARRMFHLDRELMLTGFADWPDSLVTSITAPTLVVAADRDVIRTEHAVLLASASRLPACSSCLEITAAISASSWPQREIPGRSDGHFLFWSTSWTSRRSPQRAERGSAPAGRRASGATTTGLARRAGCENA
jgi:hypothetical protein